MTDYDDLCKRLQQTSGKFSGSWPWELCLQAKAAIAALREQVAVQSNAADMIAEERDAWEKRAKALEAENAALRENKMKRGSIQLARDLCAEIAGPSNKNGNGDNYSSIDIAEILSTEVVRLRADNVALAKREAHITTPWDWEISCLKAMTDAELDDLCECRARAVKAEADNAALRAKRIALRRALRQLNKAHAVLWKVVNLQVEKIIAMRADAALAKDKP